MASKSNNYKEPELVHRGDICESEIDTGHPRVKNKFKWEWLVEKDKYGDFLSDYIRKCKENGEAWCTICKCTLKYAGAGKKVLKVHADSRKHGDRRASLQHAQALPAVFHNLKKLEAADNVEAIDTKKVVYGQSPNIPVSETPAASEPDKPKIVPLKDRVSHQEALITSFIAEHGLSLSVTPHMIQLAKELARDSKALGEVQMCRKTVGYKLNEGLSTVLHKRLVTDMTCLPFSFNLDEATSKGNKERVLNVIVSFFSPSANESVVHHYASLCLTTVNAETVFHAVMKQLEKDKIPLKNIISCLTDSASYMTGCKNGFLTRLKEVAPNLIDIDNDMCHHVHNCVKLFCGKFDGLIEKLLDDLHTDFDFGTDLCASLEEICLLLGVSYSRPKERVPHRWLSVLDCALNLHYILLPLTVFYFSWLKPVDKMAYNSVIVDILKNVSKEARQKVFQILGNLRGRTFTKAGKERKERIIDRLFFKSESTQAHLTLYLNVLPLFKEFVLCFESKEPKMHLLFDEQEELVRNFFACFLKPESFTSLSASGLLKLNLQNSEIHLSPDSVFITKDGTNSEFSKPFLAKVIQAYQETGVYIQKKFPLNNNTLRSLSAIDPRALGHSETMKCLNYLMDQMPSLLSTEQAPECRLQIRQIQILKDVKSFDKCERVDKWWGDFLQTHLQFAALGILIKACLSIFSGPRVENSFSMMNNIMTTKSNRMDTRTYSSIQAVKYYMLSHHTTSVQHFHRPDILTTPVDKPLVYHIQTARARDTERLKAASAVKNKKKAVFKLPSKPKPKPNIRQLASGIRSKLKKAQSAPKVKSASSRKREGKFKAPLSKRSRLE